MSILYFIWCALLTLPALLAALMGVGWHSNIVSIALGALAVVAWIANIGASLALLVSEGRVRTPAMIAVPFGAIFAGLGPALVRIVLPWEEPDTGDGSPMAVLMTIVLLGVAWATAIGIPALIGWVWLLHPGLKLKRWTA